MLEDEVETAGIAAFGDLKLARDDLRSVLATLDADQARAHAAEVYLGAACAADSRAAFGALDRIYIARIADVLAARRLPSHAVDEIRQTVRERLLAGKPPYLATAVGRGALASLIAVMATRAALDWLRASTRAAARHGDEAEADELARSGDPERDHLRARYRSEVKAAFEAAARELDARDRTMLRLHLVEGMTIDDVAQLYQVHRATAARQIERARDRVASGVRKLLARTAGLHGEALRELADLVTSQLDLSLSRVLAGS